MDEIQKLIVPRVIYFSAFYKHLLYYFILLFPVRILTMIPFPRKKLWIT